MLRLLKDTFEDHPDCSFVYGAYRFNDEHLNVFPSRPFDPYLLNTTNYISTMTPIKKKAFLGFNEDLEYFQDWDLFIRTTHAGHKGYFLPDVIFITESQNEYSISGSKKVPYYEKVRHIRKINNISEKPICVTSLGAPYQAIQRAKILDADYIGAHQGSSLIQMPSMFPHTYRMIYLMGFYPLAIYDHVNLFEHMQKDSLKVIQWIGTDVWQLRNKFSWEQIKYIRDKILKHIDIQLCNSDFLENELGELGIKAHCVHMPLVGEFNPVPLPKKFTIGVYYSATNPMHNQEFMVDIAKSMPDIEFKFFGGGEQAREENIEFLRWVDIHDIIRQCSMNVRISVHDGYPQLPIQFLLSGRQVITNFNMPHMHYFPYKLSKENYGECKVKLIEKIREVKRNINSKGNKTLLKRGDIYYRNITNPDNYKKIIYDILDKGKTFMFKDEQILVRNNKENGDGTYRSKKARTRQCVSK